MVGCASQFTGDMQLSNPAAGCLDCKKANIPCRCCLVPREYIGNPIMERKYPRKTSDDVFYIRNKVQTLNKGNFQKLNISLENIFY